MTKTLSYLHGYLHHKRIKNQLRIGSRWKTAGGGIFAPNLLITVVNIINGMVLYEYDDTLTDFKFRQTLKGFISNIEVGNIIPEYD